MTRMISVLGATALAFSVLACGDKDDVTDDTSSPDDTSAPDDTSDPDDTADPDDTSDPDDTGEIQYGALMDYALYEGVEGPDVSGGCTQRIGGVGEAFGGATVCADCTYSWTFPIDTREASVSGNYPSEECEVPDIDEETLSLGWAPSYTYNNTEYGPLFLYYYYDTSEMKGVWSPLAYLGEGSSDYGDSVTEFRMGLSDSDVEDDYEYTFELNLTVRGSAGAYPQK